MMWDSDALVGVNHQLCSLEELSSELKQDIDALTSKLGNKEGEWASLSKAASMLLSDFISKTERFVHCLHKTREEQVNMYLRLSSYFDFSHNNSYDNNTIICLNGLKTPISTKNWKIVIGEVEKCSTIKVAYCIDYWINNLLLVVVFAAHINVRNN